MASAPVAEDVTVAALEADPYPLYARLRREAPVAFVPAVGLWFVTRWSDVTSAAEDTLRFPATMPGSPLDRTLGGANILTVDHEPHEQMRVPMEPTLRPRRVEEQAPALVGRIADSLLDDVADRGGAELMSVFCEPLSVLSLAEVIGLPGGLDAPTMQRWFHELATGTSNYEGAPEKQRVADAVGVEIDRTLRSHLESVLASPDGSMVSDMLHAASGDLDERMASFMPTLKLALIGGLQEPGHGLGTTIAGLLSDADQLAAVLADPQTLIRKAVDEGIRWVSPIGTQGRAAERGAVLAGIEIPEGAPVGLIVQSANRDEEVWGPTADRFDLFRPKHANAAFGFGTHFCVGHQLARVQMRTGLGHLLDRLPALRPDPDRPPRFGGWEYRGPTELHVRWDA